MKTHPDAPQLRGDFIASALGVSPPPRHQEEVLGLAVLDLWRMAKERQQSIRELCRTVRWETRDQGPVHRAQNLIEYSVPLPDAP